jgi:hypothetical protein
VVAAPPGAAGDPRRARIPRPDLKLSRPDRSGQRGRAAERNPPLGIHPPGSLAKPAEPAAADLAIVSLGGRVTATRQPGGTLDGRSPDPSLSARPAAMHTRVAPRSAHQRCGWRRVLISFTARKERTMLNSIPALSDQAAPAVFPLADRDEFGPILGRPGGILTAAVDVTPRLDRDESGHRLDTWLPAGLAL